MSQEKPRNPEAAKAARIAANEQAGLSKKDWPIGSKVTYTCPDGQTKLPATVTGSEEHASGYATIININGHTIRACASRIKPERKGKK
jgi:hypothetical protein